MLKAMEHGDWKANKEGVAVVPAGEERNNHFNGDIVNQVALESGSWKKQDLTKEAVWGFMERMEP